MHPQSDKTSDLESSLELYTNIEPSTTSNNENPRSLRDRRGSIYPTSFDTSLNILFGLTDIVLRKTRNIGLSDEFMILIVEFQIFQQLALKRVIAPITLKEINIECLFGDHPSHHPKNDSFQYLLSRR